MTPRLTHTVSRWAHMVRFSHTLFALPFALAGALLAASEGGITGRQVFWILLAMVAARNAAMGFNRLADHDVDARNPRTAHRELPTGRLSRRAVWTFTVALAALFVLAAYQLHPLCGWLSPLALAIVFGYSYSKRFTWLSHFWLGLALAMAPLGGYLAVRGSVSVEAGALGLAVLFWVAGFDILYACQDIEFDRREGLFSIPAGFGEATALRMARALHALAWGVWVWVGVSLSLSAPYWVGMALILAMLLWEHRLVRPGELRKVGVAFFNMNAAVSVVYLLTLAASLWWQRP